MINWEGKTLIARQFVEMGKKELFEHISYFNRYFNENKSKNNFEMNSNRFIYMQMYNCYLILICHTDFNFLEGLEILKQIYKIIADICEKDSAEFHIKVKKNACDIILALDDIITLFYNRDGSKCTSESIKMYSFAEKEYNEKKHEKEEKAKENIIKGIEEINRLKRENKYVNTSVSSEVKPEPKVEVAVRQPQGMDLREVLMQRLIREEHRIMRKCD
jgi:hypothetical protein